ncbi:ATP-binding cassette domain-containing protein [Marinicella gelatinilytica]|uniref:ATP-binding cassette domain-containing protein n=1 Tax=Marinicella gelatinilytica TaxID=2996017 RepID=UPI002260F4B2|nr:ABC transporter ATP-binding protein [Marinicella gelatinilytica]MCX7543791.1 ABC transporter ATP-binding protein [Marinicella gelatinilytica]
MNTSAHQSSLIQLHNLTVQRQGRVLIDEMSLRLPSTGLWVLLGANGAGKSSLLRLLAGVSTATSGQIEFADGVEIGWMAEPARFYRQLTVLEHLRLQADLLDLANPEQAVQRVLEEWGLNTVKNQLTEHLSLGYRQRLSLAGALLAPVNVLLLDEPMNGMDPMLMKHFKSFLAEFKQHNLVLMATHLMAEVSKLTDCAVAMHQGQLLAQHDFQQHAVTAVDLLHFYQNSFADWQKIITDEKAAI